MVKCPRLPDHSGLSQETEAWVPTPEQSSPSPQPPATRGGHPSTQMQVQQQPKHLCGSQGGLHPFFHTVLPWVLRRKRECREGQSLCANSSSDQVSLQGIPPSTELLLDPGHRARSSGYRNKCGPCTQGADRLLRTTCNYVTGIREQAGYPHPTATGQLQMEHGTALRTILEGPPGCDIGVEKVKTHKHSSKGGGRPNIHICFYKNSMEG